MNKKTKLLGLLLSSTIALGSMQPVAANDLDGHWAKNIILEMQSKNIISGYADGSFKPNEQMTRAEFIKVINRAFGFKGNSDKKFTDVKPEDWFAGEVATAYANGYLKGFPDGSFRPNVTISRTEVAVILSRILKIEDDAAAADRFTDSVKLPAWAKGSIGALAKAGYLKGYPDGSFGFDKNITRSEAFALVYTPSNDYVAKQEQMKKEEAKKKEDAKKKEETKKKEAEKTTTPSSNSSSSGNSYSPSPQPPVEQKKAKAFSFTTNDFNITSEAGKVTVQVVYDPVDAGDKGITWEVKEGASFVAIESQTKDSITLKALDNGNYKVQATLTANPNIMNHISGTVSNQVVSVSGIGTPADKAITGLPAERIYVLESEGKYFAVNASGNLGNAYNTSDEAALYSAKLNAGVTRVNGLDNTKHYTVIDITDSYLDSKIKAYIAMNASNITLKNLKEIENVGNVLDAEIQAKLAELQNQSKEELNNLYTNQFLPKKQELEAKINALKIELEQMVNTIKDQLQAIIPDLALHAAENIIHVIEQYKADIPADIWETITGKEKLDKLKAEVERFKLFAAQTVSINEIGEIDLSGPVFTIDWELIKIENGNPIETIDRGNNSSTDTLPNQLLTLRKAGLGNYKAILTLKSEYLESYRLESELTEVKLISNDLGSLELDANLAPKPNSHSSKIRLNLAEGYLEWDSIDGATSYDVRAEMSEDSRESIIGGEYLIPTESSTDYSNIENEFSKSIHPKTDNGNWFKLNNMDDTARTFIAINLSQPRVALDKIIPHMGTNLNPQAIYEFMLYGQNPTVYIKLWIIPRNQKSLSLSDMNTYIRDINNKQANLVIDSILFKDYLEKFKILK